MATGLAKSLCDAYTVMGEEIDRLRAENERLKGVANEAIGVLESLNVFLPDHFETKQVVTETIATFRAEIAGDQK